MSGMMTLAALRKASGAPESIVRDAIGRGLVRHAWADRRLMVDEETGTRWAEAYAAALAARQPPPPPAPAADPDPVVGQAASDPAAAIKPPKAPKPKPNPDDAEPKPPTPRKPRIWLPPLMEEPAADGAKVWTVTELAQSAGRSKPSVLFTIPQSRTGSDPGPSDVPV